MRVIIVVETLKKSPPKSVIGIKLVITDVCCDCLYQIINQMGPKIFLWYEHNCGLAFYDQ